MTTLSVSFHHRKMGRGDELSWLQMRADSLVTCHQPREPRAPCIPVGLHHQLHFPLSRLSQSSCSPAPLQAALKLS